MASSLISGYELGTSIVYGGLPGNGAGGGGTAFLGFFGFGALGSLGGRCGGAV